MFHCYSIKEKRPELGSTSVEAISLVELRSLSPGAWIVLTRGCGGFQALKQIVILEQRIVILRGKANSPGFLAAYKVPCKHLLLILQGVGLIKEFHQLRIVRPGAALEPQHEEYEDVAVLTTSLISVSKETNLGGCPVLLTSLDTAWCSSPSCWAAAAPPQHSPPWCRHLSYVHHYMSASSNILSRVKHC